MFCTNAADIYGAPPLSQPLFQTLGSGSVRRGQLLAELWAQHARLLSAREGMGWALRVPGAAGKPGAVWGPPRSFPNSSPGDSGAYIPIPCLSWGQFENLGWGKWLGHWKVAAGKPLSWDSVFQNLVCTTCYDASVVSC